MIWNIKSIKKNNGMTELRKELRKDIKLALVLSSLIIPFPFLGLFSAPWWCWAIYISWIALVIYANKPRKKRRKFEHYDLREDKAA